MQHLKEEALDVLAEGLITAGQDYNHFISVAWDEYERALASARDWLRTEQAKKQKEFNNTMDYITQHNGTDEEKENLRQKRKVLRKEKYPEGFLGKSWEEWDALPTNCN